jgi:hypothetical protein
VTWSNLIWFECFPGHFVSRHFCILYIPPWNREITQVHNDWHDYCLYCVRLAGAMWAASRLNNRHFKRYSSPGFTVKLISIWGVFSSGMCPVEAYQCFGGAVLIACFLLVISFAYSSTQNMEAIRGSKTWVNFYQTPQPRMQLPLRGPQFQHNCHLLLNIFKLINTFRYIANILEFKSVAVT